MMRSRLLSEGDRAAWAAYARHVVPLPGHAMPEPPPAPPDGSAAPARPSAPLLRRPVAPPAPVIVPVAVGLQPPGLDNATWQRFRTGRLPATRTLDLHGNTAHRAYHALEAFLHRARTDRLRCVEVITGRGAGEAGGVIRRELPLWLNLPGLRPLVLAATHPHPGNTGAVRLLLRRPR